MDTQGRRIKKLRMENGFSQKKLADMVGIVTTHLQAYEYGTRHPKRRFSTVWRSRLRWFQVCCSPWMLIP